MDRSRRYLHLCRRHWRSDPSAQELAQGRDEAGRRRNVRELVVPAPSPRSLTLSDLDLHSVSDYGYNGLKVDSTWEYKVSFWAKLSAPTGGVTVSACLLSDTDEILASQEITGLTGEWAEYKTTMTPTASASTLKNTFKITVKGAADGDVMFALFSLFPPTYKDRSVASSFYPHLQAR